ncbi:MAG: hypothetical protein COY58_01540 [Gammaproteobacteria bacterium CG_4_10_14_0_8_um_filter_38_16]|nr:MAG: hypothetical protein COY58_01540 [Gammaproteobacteria bacterium CG_4_10_14_0_8_um_filter_38_16]PJA03539.1 MAG: hypothetical protein COX72_04785 [Gammaproteobacteria bacterium CG_4_10_14_0_2_um_filter_38_22]PJB11161.1 MAG: hypothetical protein CO120_01180 [Gammaproteobacteria bacterium CG_4_9_14_3_um_filter_38_9]
MIKKKWPLPFFIAHRGASRWAPENTLAALTEAKKRGAKWVECDVQLSKDHVPVIFHDAILSRTAQHPGFLSRMRFQKIQTLDVGSWFSKKFTGERVPTLHEWLQCCVRLKLCLNLEMKARTKKQAGLLAKIVLAELEKFTYFNEKKLLLSSSNLVCLTEVMQDEKKRRCGFITDKKLSEKKCTALFKKNIVSLHQPYQLLNQRYVAQLHQHGFRVLAYTVNTMATVRKMKAACVDGVFTDALF